MAESAGDGATVSIAAFQHLKRSYAVLTHQFEAASEVLSALVHSSADPEAVMTTIVESARRLCRSQAALLWALEDGVYQLIKAVGLSEESIRFIAEHPMKVDRGTMIGRVGMDRTTHQIADVLADPEFGSHDLQRVAGFRTTMGAPMLLGDRVIGALAVWRNEVRPFDEREQAIVSAFAVHAAMAVSNVKLVQQLETRSSQLAKKVEELEALREVGEAVSSSLDVDNVLSTHCDARRRAVGNRRRVDHGVLRAGQVLPGAQRVPDRPKRCRATQVGPHRHR